MQAHREHREKMRRVNDHLNDEDNGEAAMASHDAAIAAAATAAAEAAVKLHHEHLDQLRDELRSGGLWQQGGDDPHSHSAAVDLASPTINLDTLLQDFDKDHSGTIDLSEFHELMRMARSNKSQEEITNAFQAYDADGSGVIDHEELVNVLSTLGVEHSHSVAVDLDALVDDFDKDHSGTLDLNEFRDLMGMARSNKSQKEITNAFQAYDADGSGFIDRAELVKLISTLE